MFATNEVPRSPKRAFAQEIVAASNARPEARVTIAGTKHIEVLIELIRRGFSMVMCRVAGHGPHVPGPPADILIVPDCKSDAELRCVLTRLGCDLRPRGGVVVTHASPSSAIDERLVRRVLMECGFTAVERIGGSRNAAPIWLAYKAASSLRHAA